MKKRELIVVGSNKVVGAVGVDDEGSPLFQGGAAQVFSGQLRKSSRKKVADDLLKNGWANGYVYLGDVKEE